jgi:hypothetical protein
MPDDSQDAVHSSSDGGVVGKHPGVEPFRFFVAPATDSEFNTAHLRLIPIACFRVDDMRFQFDSSFVLPEVQSEIAGFADLRESDPCVHGAPISIFGHADPTYQGNFEPRTSTAKAGDDYNKTLSGRRAISIYALLVRDASIWNNLYTNHLGGDVWGETSIHVMLDATDESDSGDGESDSQSQGRSQGSSGASSQTSSASARNARVRDIASDSGQRQQLFLKYMDFLCGDLKLDKGKDFLARGAGSDLKGDVQGCSRFNPSLLFSTREEERYEVAYQQKDTETLSERNHRNSQNRRVLILVFRKGSQVLPAKWPCPTYREDSAGCKKRFWSDGDNRRSLHDAGGDRNFSDTHDTFACRFFQRISSSSPCHQVLDVAGSHISVLLRSNSGAVPLVNLSYRIRIDDDKVLEGKTDEDGLIQHPDVPPGDYPLELGGKKVDTLVHTLPEHIERCPLRIPDYLLFDDPNGELPDGSEPDEVTFSGISGGRTIPWSQSDGY